MGPNRTHAEYELKQKRPQSNRAKRSLEKRYDHADAKRKKDNNDKCQLIEGSTFCKQGQTDMPLTTS